MSDTVFDFEWKLIAYEYPKPMKYAIKEEFVFHIVEAMKKKKYHIVNKDS